MNKLEYIAARLAFDQVDANEIRKTVDELLMQGVYSDHFIDIIETTPPILADVRPPFEAYLATQGISVPNREKAVWQIINHHVSRISAGEADPIEELKLLISEVYWAWDFHSSTKKYLGDSYGIEHFIGIYWEYDDMMEGSLGRVSKKDTRTLKSALIKHSNDWIKNFANNALQHTAGPRHDF